MACLCKLLEAQFVVLLRLFRDVGSSTVGPHASGRRARLLGCGSVVGRRAGSKGAEKATNQTAAFRLRGRSPPGLNVCHRDLKPDNFVLARDAPIAKTVLPHGRLDVVVEFAVCLIGSVSP